MEQVFFCGHSGNLDSIITKYNSLIGGNGWETTEPRFAGIVSTDGILKNLRVKLTTGAPGAGTHYDITLLVNGAPAALTVEVADAATTGDDMVNEIDIVPGDTVSMQCAPDSNPTGRYVYFSVVFEGDNANESLILGGSISTLLNDTTEFTQIMQVGGSWIATENGKRQVIPTAGTITNLYVKLSIAPGTDPDAYRFTVRLNGATVAQSSIVTITADATTGNDVAHNLVVAAGDVPTLMVEPLNSPSATPTVNWGMTFIADTDGESIVLGGTIDDLNDTATEYNVPTGSGNSGWSTESFRRQMGQACTIKKLYMLLSGSPGAGNKYTFTLRVEAADSNVVAEVAEAATTGNSGALEDTVANDEFVSVKVVPTDTPTVRDAYWGFVAFLEPAAAGGGAGAVVMGPGALTKILLQEGVID